MLIINALAIAHPNDSIERSARMAARAQRHEETMQGVLEKVLANSGINIDLIDPMDFKRIMLNWRTHVMLNGEPVQSEKYAKYGYPTYATPEGFWESIPGLIEAKRRIGNYFAINKELPMELKKINELGLGEIYTEKLEAGLTQSQFFVLLGFVPNNTVATGIKKASDRKPVDSIPATPPTNFAAPQTHTITTPLTPAAKAAPRRAQRLGFESTLSQEPISLVVAPLSRPSGALEDIPLEHQYLLRRALDIKPILYPDADKYGYTLQAPNSFLSSQEANRQAILRIFWFIHKNPANPEHRDPTAQEIIDVLKLGVYVNVFAGRHNGDTDIVTGLGFRHRPDTIHQSA